MSEANSNTTTSAINAAPHKSFMGNIAGGFHRLSHDHSSHQTYQYGTADSAHDNAYIGEAGIVGAHAIPPQPGTETSHSQPKASSDHDNHQYGGAENHHDNTYISEAAMTGTHAVPPMTFHARHDLKEKPKQGNQKMKQPETQ